MTGPLTFQIAGTIGPNAIYIERATDAELTAMLREAPLCHIVGPPQIGKSSMALHLKESLSQTAGCGIYLDLNGYGTTTSPEGSLYNSLIFDSLERLTDEEPTLPPGDTRERLMWWLQQLDKIAEERQVVLIIDEFGLLVSRSVILLEAIAAHLTARPAGTPRASVLLLGIFNIPQLLGEPGKAEMIRAFFGAGGLSRRIELVDFKREELSPFAQALPPSAAYADALLDRIAYWTSGHPYMTQMLCLQAAKWHAPEADAATQIDRLVNQLFLVPNSIGDPCLAWAHKLLCPSEGGVTGQARRLRYKTLLKQGELLDDPKDPYITDLILAGLVVRRRVQDQTRLVVRNRIIMNVFDDGWFLRNAPADEARSETR